MTKMTIALLAGHVLLISSAVSAQDDGIYMEGTIGYEFFQENVWLDVEKIANYGPDGSSSGTLKLELWATDNPYDGSPMPGWELGSAELGVLDGGYHWDNVSEPAYIWDLPPAGQYYISMFLSEWDGSEFGILEYVNFPDEWMPFSDLLWHYFERKGDWLYGWIGHFAETPVYDWIYRTWAEWLYAVYDTADSGYFWSPYEGWIWMSQASSPYFYSLQDQTWYFYPDW